jgi:uncharacterized protein YaiE (UPF0345 family)
MPSLSSVPSLAVAYPPTARLDEPSSWWPLPTRAARVDAVHQPKTTVMPLGMTFALPKSKLAAGQQLVCLEGTVWITRDGHPEDHVLEAGQSWAVPANASTGVRVLVHALRDARVQLRAMH